MLMLMSGGHAHASLVGRDADGNPANGYEAYYDTVLDITWLADANLAYTTGVATAEQGRMSWLDTTAWIDQTVNAAGLHGVSTWRLPSYAPVDGTSYQLDPSVTPTAYFDGTIDYGINNASTSSELGYMYYVNLGLLAWADTTGTATTGGYGFDSPGVTLDNEVTGGYYNTVQLADVTVGAVTFSQVAVHGGLWTGATVTNDPYWGSGQSAFYLTADNGQIDLDAVSYDPNGFDTRQAAWLVTDGDPFSVSAVPEPASGVLMAAGAGLFAVRARRMKKGAASQRP